LFAIAVFRRTASLKSEFAETGVVILEALQRGVKRIIICIEGTSTMDGGTGIAILYFHLFTVNSALLIINWNGYCLASKI